jgi:hypothetical protein
MHIQNLSIVFMGMKLGIFYPLCFLNKAVDRKLCKNELLLGYAIQHIHFRNLQRNFSNHR